MTSYNFRSWDNQGQRDPSLSSLTPNGSHGGARWNHVNHGRLPEGTLALFFVILMDVMNSASRVGDHHRRMREDLHSMVAAVLAASRLHPGSLSWEDRGDGLRLVLPAGLISPTDVVDTFVLRLSTALREHRRYVSEAARIRLRIAFDLGLLAAHRGSWTGEPVIRVARLVDAEAARDLLTNHVSVDLAVVVSNGLFESVVRHGYGRIAPDCFRQIQVTVKEFDKPAWLLVPHTTSSCADCWRTGSSYAGTEAL
jgi:hypothetical protein